MFKITKKYQRKILVASLIATQLLFNSGFWWITAWFTGDNKSVQASTAMISTYEDWEAGELTNVVFKDTNGSLKLATNGSWDPKRLESPFLPIYIGASQVSAGNYIYVMRGYGDNSFYRYDPRDNTWNEMTRPSFGAYYGSDLVVIGNYIYAIFGGYQKAISRYDILNDSWTNLTASPEQFYTGASLATDGTDIYALKGSASEVMFYDVSEDSWSYKLEFSSSISYGDMEYYDGFLYFLDNSNPNKLIKYDVISGGTTALATIPGRNTYETDISLGDGYIYVARSTNTTGFYRYDLTNGDWETLANTPDTVGYGGGVTYHQADGFAYVLRGNNTYDFYKYDVSNNAFKGVADSLGTLSTGSDLIELNSKFYVPRGANTTTFYEYDPAGDTWTTKMSLPASQNYYTRGVSAGGLVYLIRGNSTSFYSYNPGSDTWDDTLATAPVSSQYAQLGYPGSGDYIYATRGHTTSTFWRYSISGDSWDDVGAADLPSGVTVGAGSAMVSDGTDLYLMLGDGTPGFYKYDVSENTWSARANLKFAPYIGADLAYGNGKIMATVGNYDDELWEYSVTGNSWRKAKNISEYYGYRLGIYNGGSLGYDGSGAFYVTRGSGLNHLYKYTPGVGDYPVAGTYISEVQDLTYVNAFDGMSVTMTTPGDSGITVETRTSSDMSSWTNWEATASGNLVSAANRYLQVKATLLATSDQTQTPQLDDITISYSGDVTDPVNPSSAVGVSQQVGGVSLTSGNTYSYAHPYFTFSGSDTESGVDGYYVYFGTNASANPETSGSYQAAGTYTATEAMSAGSYYLIVKTKDVSGNIAEASTIFTYVYQGVAGTQSSTFDETTEFTGTVDGASILNDEIKLASTSGFWLQDRVSLMPFGLQYGGKTMAYVASSNKLYILQGANNTAFYEYDLSTDTWTSKAVAPDTVRMGGGVVEGPSGYLFALRGNNTNSFWRYDIVANTWDDAAAADAPSNTYYGSSMVYDGSQYIYATRGDSDDSFWRYDTQNNSWNSSLAKLNFGASEEAINNNAYAGAEISFDGTDTIYAIQGNNLDGFASYSITNNVWTVLTDVPSLPYTGASIIADGTNDAVYFTPGNGRNNLFKYSTVTQTWAEMTPAPASLSYGSDMRKIGTKIYITRGGNQTQMYVYNPVTDTWRVPTTGLFGTNFYGTTYDAVNYGGGVIKGAGNYFYLMRGSFGNEFIRYDAATGVSKVLANLPSGAYRGASLVYESVNNKIYYHPGYTWNHFYVYDVATNSWLEESSDAPPLIPDYGSSMTFDGSRYIYMNRGSATTTFWQFDTQGSSGSKWSTLATAPGGLGYGAELVYKSGYVYTLRGQNVANNSFYRYDVSQNTWSDGAAADLNIDVYNDGFLVDGNDGYFYASRGENDTEWYRYSLAADSWESLVDVPANVYVGGSGASDGSGKIFVLAGPGTNTFNDGLYVYVQQTEESGFGLSGTYTSQAHDLTNVYRFGNLQVSYTTAADSNLVVETRTSADSNIWSSWDEASETKAVGGSYEYQINSSANQYLQVKFSLTAVEGIYSGVVSDYTVNWYQDINEPSNPTSLMAYQTATQSAEIVTNTWYNYAEPNFDWPEAEAVGGASDTSGGSGVVGYYVYFGTTADANPVTLGAYQTTTAYTASSLVSGQTYYLRIKTVDDNGQVSSNSWQPFVYKYDSSNPEPPTSITADPSGYSATNNFDFSWVAGSDLGSGIDSYCYKTATASGIFASDQCEDVIRVASVSAYQNGANTFYVRSKDQAGNYSSYGTVSYYFNTGAPSAPTNLTVSPATNTVNSFSFDWDPPLTYLGNVTAIKYYYSINALPTAVNVTETTATALGSGPYATLPSTNTFYIVAKDEAGNINYGNYANVSFTANTSAPGIPLNIDIADVSVKATSSWKLAISWEEPSSLGAGIATYKVYRSLDEASYSLIASTGGISYVDTGLTQQTYYYKVKACDSTNNCGEFSSVVTLYPDGKYIVAADLAAEPVITAITTTKAMVSWSTNRTCDSKVAFGTESGSYNTEEVSSSTHVTAHTLNLSNLAAGTTYYFVAKWTDEDGNTGVSQEYSFNTEPAPSVKDVVVDSVSLDSAIISYTVTGASGVKILYGPTTLFGGSVELTTGTAEATYTTQLTGLLDGTKYYYQINTYDAELTEYEGTTLDFETLPRPKLEVIKLQQVKGTSSSTILLTWASNTPVSSIVTYYPSANPAAAQDNLDVKLTTAHRVVVKGLLPNTAYTVLVKGRDKVGNEALSTPQSFTTASDTRPPTIANLKVESVIQGVGEEAIAQLVVSWDTDELSTSQVSFGDGSTGDLSSRTQEDQSLTFNHMVVVPNLQPSKVYHLKALSKDDAANEAQSIDTVVITPKATKSALNLVVSNLSQAFGFLGGISQ